MSHKHTVCAHTIRIAAPVEQCQRFFTPAGEELWVDGWRPTYLHPADGRTRKGMVFTTGDGDDFTIWTLADYSVQAPLYARYLRVTPATRCVTVEVTCAPSGPEQTTVDVRYTLTALNPAGEKLIDGFAGDNFERMIDGWKSAIDQRLPQLRVAQIR